MYHMYWTTCALVMTSVLLSLCGTGMTDTERLYSANVTRQEFVDGFAAPIVSAVGGNAYAGANESVCIAHRADGPYIPLTASMLGRLYGVVNNGTLDPLHGCYLSDASADGTRSCVAQISSSPAECGGDAEQSLSTASSELDVGHTNHVFKSGAEALVASIQLPYGSEQLTLLRSLLYTREVESLLSTEEALLQNSRRTLESVDNLDAREAASVSDIRTLVERSYDIVMAKYDVLRSWLNQSLGGVGGVHANDHMLLSLPTACPLNRLMEDVLRALTPDEVMEVAKLMMSRLKETVMNQQDHVDKAQALVCLQGIYVVAALAIEDARIRRFHQKFADGTISVTNASTHMKLALYLSTSKEDISNKMGIYFEMVMDSIAERLFGAKQKGMAECVKRAVLRVPYPSTGEVPPSIYWCLNSTLVPAGAGRVVWPYMSERVASRCPPGQSVWSGSCGGEFDVGRCVLCPAGSVLRRDGYCGCVDPDSYVKRTGGCTQKGEGNEPPTFKWELAEGSVVVVPSDDAGDGDGKVPKELFTVSLPSDVAVGDESAYLSVSAVCELGVTTLMVSPVGNRSAVCGEEVSYERRVERTGSMFVGPGREGSVVAETYAASVRVSVVSTGGVFGDTCTFTAAVGSTLRKVSESISVGRVTLLIQAAPLKLTTSGSRLSDGNMCDALPSQPPGGDGIVVGVCRSPWGMGGLYLDARGYRYLPSTGLDGILNSAAVCPNTSLLKSRLNALSEHVGLRMTVLGADGVELTQFQWIPSHNETSGTVWRAVRVRIVPYEVLKAMRRVRVEVLDLLDGSALAPRLDTMAYMVSESELSALHTEKPADHPEKSDDVSTKHALLFNLPWSALLAVAVILCMLIASQIWAMVVLKRRIRKLEENAVTREGRGLERAPH